MNSSKYLYDVEPFMFQDMPYEEALEYKCDMARDLMKKIAVNKDDEERYVAAEKALHFNTTLLDELKEM